MTLAWIFLRISLIFALTVTILFYVLLAVRILPGGYQFLRFGSPVGMLLNLHDLLSLLLIFYWTHLVRRLRPVNNPLFPFLVFFVMAVVEPYLLLGKGGVELIRSQRFVTFYLSYPVALVALALWVIVWVFRYRSSLPDNRRQEESN